MGCSRCGHENPPGAKFCLECGAGLTRQCRHCQASLPPAAKFCLECGTSAPSLEAPRTESRIVEEERSPSAERRQLTVLFCDLVGSTALSGQLDPEDYRAVVRRYHDVASAVVERYGGHVAQYLGDGLLVYFGWPRAYDDAAERAVRAGLALLDLMRSHDTPLPLAIRVGMDTGAVVVAPERTGADVFGETPNIAARVQAMAAPNEVLISAATFRLVVGLFVVEDRGPQELKGVSRPVVLYRVVQPSGVRSRLDVAEGRLTRFAGREIELATLWDRWERVVDGEGQSALVLGEAGVGKSRLVYELRRRLASTPHTWLECRCTPYTTGTPFAAVMELLAPGLACAPEDTAGNRVENLGAELARAGLVLEEAVPLMAVLLGLTPPVHYPLPHMSPEVQRRRTIELLAAWTLALSGAQPLLVVVEDLHWCDPSSLELFGRLIEQSPSARLLFVASARPELAVPWPPRSHLTTLHLTRLTKSKARELVLSVAGQMLAAEVVEALVERADGVPLYLEELTKSVVEPGADHGVEAIPGTLQDSLMARLDRLSTAKDVAQRAAVLGREFEYPLLAAVAGLEEAVLQEGLTRLIGAEILFARGEPPRVTYTFKHALVQEAAYESLLRRTREQFHKRVVEVLAASFPERVAAEPEVAARHAEAAGLRDEAIAYWQQAGARAMALPAYEEASAHFAHALETLAAAKDPDLRLRWQLLFSLGTSFGRSGAISEARTAFFEAAALARTLRAPEQLAKATLGFVGPWSSEPSPERRPLLEEALDALGDEDTQLRARILARLALEIFDIYWADHAQAAAMAEEALVVARRVKHPAALADALVAMINVKGFVGQVAERLSLADELEALTREKAAMDLVRRGILEKAVALLETGAVEEFDRVTREFEQAARASRQPLPLHNVTTIAGMRALLAGRLDDAENVVAELFAIVPRLGFGSGVAANMQRFLLRREQGRLDEILAVAEGDVEQRPVQAAAWKSAMAAGYTDLGMVEQARSRFERLAAHDFADVPVERNWSTAMAFLAETCAFLGDERRAGTLYELLSPHADRFVVAGWISHCLGSVARYVGLLARTIGRRDEAVKLFGDALAANERIGARTWAAWSRYECADTLFERDQPGDRSRAVALLDEALAAAEQIGMVRLAERAGALRGYIPQR